MFATATRAQSHATFLLFAGLTLAWAGACALGLAFEKSLAAGIAAVFAVKCGLIARYYYKRRIGQTATP